MKSAIRLGDSNANDQTYIKSRPLKLVMEHKELKATIFAVLKNLKIADNCYKNISVSHDCSKETRELIREKINTGKERDGENAG